MSQVGERERFAQNRIVKLFTTPEANGGLGYTYLGDWHERAGNANVEETLLRTYLAGKYSPTLIDKAVFEFTKATKTLTHGLYFANMAVYQLLRYGVQVKEDAGENFQTVQLIDWAHPTANHFGLAEEVTVVDKATKRPDLVLYVNGIALGVIELKRSKVWVAEGIRQNLDNQKAEFILPFFTTMQLVMAGNDTEGLRYGTILTPEKYYLTWRADEDTQPPAATDTPLDWAVAELCQKTRFLELLYSFIVFDRGIKKVPRPHQYHGIKLAQQRVRQREGGIIWHTQGSGKSLTMVWFTNWLLENVPDARVLIVTDRTELDKQIEDVFKGVSKPILRTKSGTDLLKHLNNPGPSLVCSLIHKFSNRQKTGPRPGDPDAEDYDAYIDDLKRAMPSDFKPKGDLYVFVDECHRTQSGLLHGAMKTLLPNAVFIGFTGTPLLKTDKDTSTKIFGSYIHQYKFDQAVRDGVVLDLRYEARDVNQDLSSPKKIDQWFDSKTKNMTENARVALKQRWGTLRSMYSSKDRLEKIVGDILLDMADKPRLASGSGNALLVSDSVYNACKYYELFQQTELAGKCAIVTSYRPSLADIKGESTGEGQTEKLRKYQIYNQMLAGKDPEVFEDEVKNLFVHHPGQMKLLIVVDKLLTGFDAPSATYLYIDKHMQDHGLFQAICRVNRLDGDDKEYGYIVDYKDLFQSLEKSVHDYTLGPLDGYDDDDVDGLLGERVEKGREHLDETLEVVRTLCEPVEAPRHQEEFKRYFVGPDLLSDEHARRRMVLYRAVAGLLRAYADIANDLEAAGFTTAEAAQLKQEVKFYENVRAEIRLASADFPDLKQFEPAMRHLIDTYIDADESRVLTAFDDMPLVQLLVERGKEAALNALPASMRTNKEAVAETIVNNVRRLIINAQSTNPIYFGKMSEVLEALVERRKEAVLEYEAYLNSVIDVAKQTVNPPRGQYPASLKTRGQQALYDNFGQDEVLTLALDRSIHLSARNGWHGSDMKTKEIRIAIRKVLRERLNDDKQTDAIVKLVEQQPEYRK
jgi:type I restriction enzyme, R subunit